MALLKLYFTTVLLQYCIYLYIYGTFERVFLLKKLGFGGLGLGLGVAKVRLPAH